MSSTEYAHPPFDVVYETLFPIIYRVSLRVTGDRKLQRISATMPSSSSWNVLTCLPDLEQSKYWLIRVVKNLSLNYEKRRKREKAAYSKFSRLSVTSTESSEKQVMKEETKVDVQCALDALPYKLRLPARLPRICGPFVQGNRRNPGNIGEQREGADLPRPRAPGKGAR